MVHCPGCDQQVAPFVELDESMRPITRCPVDGCGHRFRSSMSEEQTTVIAVEPYEAKPLIPKAEPSDVVEFIRTRLARIDAELLTMKKLEDESRMLRLMLAAANVPAVKEQN